MAGLLWGAPLLPPLTDLGWAVPQHRGPSLRLATLWPEALRNQPFPSPLPTWC